MFTVYEKRIVYAWKPLPPTCYLLVLCSQPWKLGWTRNCMLQLSRNENFKSSDIQGLGIRSFDLWSFNLFDLQTRSTVTVSISSIFEKDQTWSNWSRRSFDLWSTVTTFLLNFQDIFLSSVNFAGLGICSFSLSLFVLLLKITDIKEWLWAIRSRRSLKKSNREQIALKKWAICSKKTYFLNVFDSFPHFYAQAQIAPVANDKRALGAICSFSLANGTFTLLLTKKEWFNQKTDKRILNPAPLRK